jgi:UDP-3-O-[3-hydroxymyristoyl] glucosamine N-acyltransferase
LPVEGDGTVEVSRVATLESAGPGTIAFLARTKYRKQLATTNASAVIVAPAMAADTSLPKLLSPNPYATFAKVAAILHPAPALEPGCHPPRSSTPRANRVERIDRPACDHRRAPVVGERASVGASCVVGAGVSIGEDVVLHANVTIYDRC